VETYQTNGPCTVSLFVWVQTILSSLTEITVGLKKNAREMLVDSPINV